MSELSDMNKNYSFSTLRGIDLQELLREIEKTYIEYRYSLNLSKDVTIGIEIEYERILINVVDKFLTKRLNGWKIDSDYSLEYGGEVKSPIMIDNERYWQELKIICSYLTKKRADVAHNAGGHIHLGAHILGNNLFAWKSFIKLYTAYENVLFRFLYGDKVNGRKKINTYAYPVADIFYKYMDEINRARSIDELKRCLPVSKRSIALNLSNVNFFNPQKKIIRNTIEFRSPNATTNEIIWQNNINTLAKILVSAQEKKIDVEFLDYKLASEFKSYEDFAYLYNNVNLKNALEFVDLVFDNNLDKIYFLKQYIKDFQDNLGLKTMIRAKKFIK